MDQILHRKLIIEKNNLELQVAKANKEVAKLMETVQQYEAVLASLDEGMIPNKKGISEDLTIGRLNLSTLARAARKALDGSNTQSTLGKRYTPGTVATSPVDPYVGEVQTPRVAAMGGIPRGAFKQPDGNLGKVRRLTPNEAKYDASKRSKKPVQEATKQLGENGMGSANDMDLRRLQRKAGGAVDLGASTGPEGVHVSGDPKVTAAMTQRHMQLQKQAGAKPARPHYYIKGNPAHVEESTQLDEIITPAEARGSRRALAMHQAARMERILASHNAQANAAHDRAGVITQQFGDKQYDRAQRVADLARRLGANPEVHPGSRGTIDQGYTSQEGSTKSKLRYFEPGSETEQNQAVARMQNRRDERMRKVDQTKFGF